MRLGWAGVNWARLSHDIIARIVGQTAITVAIAFLSGTVFWGLVRALIERFRFDGISVDFVESTVGAIGLYSRGVPEWGIRLTVTNVGSTPIAIEKIHVEWQLKPPTGTSKVRLARGQCRVSVIQDGPYGTDERTESYPIVVPAGGGRISLQLDAHLEYYSKAHRFLIIPYWRRMDGIGIEDPDAPVSPDGEKMYHHIVDVQSLQLKAQINSKMRKLHVEVFKYK